MLTVDGVTGYLLGCDIEFLKKKAARIPEGGTYLEIGSWMGLSAITVAKELRQLGNTTARVYCIDTWRGSEEHQDQEIIKKDQLYGQFISNVERSGFTHIIIPTRNPSIEAAKTWSIPLDMVFVDGDHTYKGCYKDIMSWFPKLKAKGNIFGHDAAPNSPVRKSAIDAAKVLNKEVIFHDLPIAHYIWEFK